MEMHSMGLHDEYVLGFMYQKLQVQKEPFFSTMYNISTHYPNDLPVGFKDSYPAINKTAPMKSMAYYDQCLQQFFNKASQLPWFNNTVFIFCSDHWATPRRDNVNIDVVESFRIPIFIYDPSARKKSVVNNMVSQLDIMNSILYYAGYTGDITSYGINLIDTITNSNRVVFTKTNTSIYQAINNQFVLGFDAAEGNPLYCYDYRNDKGRNVNLLKQL
jgi:phosphoglycerol transferase MdoB-like AlkP superfamily enzyme